MTGLFLGIAMYVLGAYTPTTDYAPLREVTPFYDYKYNCDIREGGYTSDNFYISDCGGFFLVFDTKNLLWWRIREHEFLDFISKGNI